jgi:predicted metal-dependent phosphoesterase TrpH
MLFHRIARDGFAVAGLLAANSQGQKDVWAKRDRKARIAKNMPRVEAAIAANRADAVAAREADEQRARIAQELADVQADIEALRYQLTAVETTKAAWGTAVEQFSA